MPKNAMEPTPKFDCHLSKSANRVTSLLSYRAFELTQVNTTFLSFSVMSMIVCFVMTTLLVFKCVSNSFLYFEYVFVVFQQYFFEFAFNEIKARPRHLCPYAVVSFQYKGKEAAAAPMTAHRYIYFKLV